MIVPLLGIIRMELLETSIPMTLFYSFYKISRQGYHQAVSRHKAEQSMMESIRIKVERYRFKKDRRAGSRSLFYNLEIKKHYKIGVNKFERMLSASGLSLMPQRLRVVTTQSVSQSWNYGNLTNGLILRGIHELVVGDITYLTIGKYRYYLFCLTDVFSMKIVGYCISNRMRKQEAMIALKMFVEQRGVGSLKRCVHHTDGGGQYFAAAYLAKQPKWIDISVAKSCLENGLAEQKNGYIKNHLVPLIKFRELKYVKEEMKRLIDFYNTERKQEVLGWRTPIEVEQQVSEVKYNNRYFRLHDHINNVPSIRFGF